MKCLKCHKKRALKDGLCLSCYDDHGHDLPTNATPGSEEKIKILEIRASLRMSLDHPKDKRIKD